MATPTSRFLTGGRTRLIGTSLGAPGAGEYPNSAMYWPGGVTPGWPSGDLDNYNQWKAMTGRKPDIVRLYSTNAFATTGVTGSAGAYGLISSDQRAIANDQAILYITFTDPAESWGTIAANLNAAGSNATKTRYLSLIQNLKRWKDDTGNTNTLKSILFGCKHEPSNDGGIASDYRLMWQAVFNFFLDNGIGDGPQPTTGHGSSYVGTWYNMLEWAFVDIGFNFANGTPAQTYAANYYPGDGFARWVFFDIYGWGGGQGPGAGQALTDAKAGKVPQPGRTITAGHYNDGWKTIQQVASNPLEWYKGGPGGSRPVILGLGEWAMSEDIDTFTISGGSLANPKTKSGDPHMKADWFKGAQKYFRGEVFTVAGGHNAINNISLSTDGLLFVAPIHWNSQAAMPRWWNSIPFQTGDTTGPSTGGAQAHETYDAFVALVNDSIFSTTPVIHTPPTLTTGTWHVQDGGAPGDIELAITVAPGDGAIVSYAWDPGDGSGIVTHTTAATSDILDHTYATSGLFHAQCVVTDANGLLLTVAAPNFDVVVQPADSPLAGAPYINPLDRVKALRFTYNPAIDALEGYTQSRVARIGMGTGTWTNQPSAVTQWLGGNTARKYVDLKGYTKIKTSCFLSVAGVTNAKVAPAYSIDGGATWKFFDTSGTSGTTVSSSLLGATCLSDTATFHVGSWGDIPLEARIEGVLVTLYGAGGDGAADPVFESVALAVK